jgi:hypothetical protein
VNEAPSIGNRNGIYVEPWSGDYGSPMQIDPDDGNAGTAKILGEEGFDFVMPPELEPVAIAFVDGVRRQECLLSRFKDGRTIAGITGAYAVGAVLCEPEKTPIFSSEQVERLVIWSSGCDGALPPVLGGWAWVEDATGESGPAAPMRHLQGKMRRAEARLGDQLAQDDYLVLLDGTLWFASAYDKKNVAGYVKTHHVRLLPEPEAMRLPALPAGSRTTIFQTAANRYTSYLRLTPRGQYAPPMAGIVRLEFSGSLPLNEVRAMADRFAAMLPKFAGIAHVDPRAPQNLQPIGALEIRLRHLLGDQQLAERAARDSVASIREQ